jgi:hypothetical protein
VGACLRNASLTAGYTNSDVDIFVVGLGEEAAVVWAQALVVDLEAAFQRQGIEEYDLLSTRNTITLCHPDPRLVEDPNSPGGKLPMRTIQIVQRTFPSVWDVLDGFDVDRCCFACDGVAVWAHPRGIRAFRMGINVVDMQLSSWMLGARLVKYMLRGYAVLDFAYTGWCDAGFACLEGLVMWDDVGDVGYDRRSIGHLKSRMRHLYGIELLVLTELYYEHFGQVIGAGQSSTEEAWKDDYPSTRSDEPANDLIRRVNRVLAVAAVDDDEVRAILDVGVLTFEDGVALRGIDRNAPEVWARNVYPA